MPCRDDRDDHCDNSALQARADKVTRLLCGLCRNVEQLTSGGARLISTNKELAAWWKEHQEADRKRLEAEAAEKETERKRQAALSKLSPEERKLLKIR